MNDPKTPILNWSKLSSETWTAGLPVAESWENLFVHRDGSGFHLELPFCIDKRSDAATPEEAQAEAEQYVANVLLEAATRLRQPNSADHVE